MRLLKSVATGLVVVAALALGAPSVASAGSINGFGFGFHRIVLGWSSHLSDQVRHRTRRTYTPTTHTQNPRDGKDCTPDHAVPEPTAALLFGLGAALVATRTRKRS
jgi:hypothetical protein